MLARLIDAHPDFHPRAWIDELPGSTPLGRSSSRSPASSSPSARRERSCLALEQQFGGHLPSPDELLAADPQVLRASGLSARKGATLRALAERFVDGRLSDEALRADDRRRGRGSTDRGIRASDRGQRTASSSSRSTDPTCSSAATSHSGARVQRLYGFDHLPTEAEMIHVAERWRPYRSLAVSYLFASEFEERGRWTSESSAPADSDRRWRAPHCAPAVGRDRQQPQPGIARHPWSRRSAKESPQATVDEAASTGIVVIAVPWNRVPEPCKHHLEQQGRHRRHQRLAADDLQGRTSSEIVAGLVAGARSSKPPTR